MKKNSPEIFLENINTAINLAKFKRKVKVWKTIDIYEKQLHELFEIRNPKLLKDAKYENKLDRFVSTRTKPSKKLKGNWVYFPWSGYLIHMVNENEYLELRTNRNRNLITRTEQKKLYNKTVGVVGLSVGSGIATGLEYQGIAKNLKLAEFDTLETTNLNRIRAGVGHVGNPKIDIVAQQIYEVNPYANLTTYPKGLTRKDLNDFIYNKPKPKIIFEIVDDFEMKVRIRIEARKAKIPVIGPANLGDRILWDIERYDTDKSLPLFNGVLGDFPEEILDNPDEDKNKYAVRMVKPANIPIKALQSVKQIGKSLVGRPQLSSTVTTSGALGTYIARKILLGEKLESGRYLLDFDNFFNTSQ